VPVIGKNTLTTLCRRCNLVYTIVIDVTHFRPAVQM
jgi:hypothetical protein